MHTSLWDWTQSHLHTSLWDWTHSNLHTSFVHGFGRSLISIFASTMSVGRGQPKTAVTAVTDAVLKLRRPLMQSTTCVITQHQYITRNSQNTKNNQNIYIYLSHNRFNTTTISGRCTFNISFEIQNLLVLTYYSRNSLLHSLSIILSKSIILLNNSTGPSIQFISFHNNKCLHISVIPDHGWITPLNMHQNYIITAAHA